MGLRLVTPPTATPISRAELRTQCRLDVEPSEDALLDSYLAAATSHIERMTGRALVTQTWELVLDDFTDAIQLPRSPIQSVSSITYYDLNGTLQTLNTQAYAVDNVNEPGWIVPVTGQRWPDVAQGVNNVIIRFVAGYGPPAQVPGDLRHAVALLAADWYLTREDTNIGNIVTSMPNGVRALLANYRLFA